MSNFIKVQDTLNTIVDGTAIRLIAVTPFGRAVIYEGDIVNVYVEPFGQSEKLIEELTPFAQDIVASTEPVENNILELEIVDEMFML